VLPARRVRRLHLRADAEDDARHAATLLTDALRTASLPAADQGRLIVIRRLALGRISAHVSPASLALHIERVTRDVISQAVDYDLPAADTANAVVLPNRSDAIITLARRHAGSAPANEWFWTAVVPGWRANASRGERWSLLLDATHDVPEAAIVAAAVIAQAVGAGVEDALLSSIPAGQGAHWLRLEGWSSSAPEPLPPPRQHLARHRAEIIHQWRQNWGPTDDRLVWLTTLLTVTETPASVADPRLPAKVASALKAFERVSAPRSDPESPITTHADLPGVRENPAPRILQRASAPPSDPQFRIDSGQSASSVDAPQQTAITREPFNHESDVGDRWAEAGELVSPRSRVEFEREHIPPGTLSGELTECAGLLFLVPILERLAFAQFLASHPTLLEGGFPAQLLSFIGRRVGLTPNDPLALAFRTEINDERGLTLVGDIFHLPIQVREILSTPKPRTALDSPFMAWLTAIRRWCRRYLRMGLMALIRRPGRVYTSRTHIDACFALSQVDVRVRRLALDVDPGWVPWMGRVVQFNYLNQDEHTA
jgi:hypothetical protein